MFTIFMLFIYLHGLTYQIERNLLYTTLKKFNYVKITIPWINLFTSLDHQGLYYSKIWSWIWLSELWTIISKKLFTTCCHTYWINYYFCGPETFSRHCLLLKVDCFEGSLNQMKYQWNGKQSLEYQLVIKKFYANIQSLTLDKPLMLQLLIFPDTIYPFIKCLPP